MTHRPVEIDARTISPADRHARIFSTFDELQPGDAMVLVVDHDPHPLLYQLQVEKPGDFNWSPLEEGPRVWRVRIDKRAPSHKRHRGANEYLAWDHDRLDALIEHAQADARARNWREVQHGFAEFRVGLLRHIRMEEELLFTAFEDRSGMGKNEGPTAVMREEHQEIQASLAALVATVAHAAAGAREDLLPAFESELRRLLDVLVEHNVKEEQVLYPTLDHMLSEDERDSLVRKMMAVHS